MNICSHYKECLIGKSVFTVSCACQYPHEEDSCCEKSSVCLIVDDYVKCEDIRKVKLEMIEKVK